ncbi:MAG: DUF2079 domain-containing protein, partial [Oscillospiraceae bacterium]|nr:DUF2079 domain-containing protein [Oscillospiraceae bacterium]
ILIKQFLKTKKTKAENFLKTCGIPDKLFCRLVGFYFWVSGMEILSARKQNLDIISKWKDFVEQFSFGGKIFWVIFGAFVATMIYFGSVKKQYDDFAIFKYSDEIVLATGVIFFSCCLMWKNDNFYLCMGVMAIAIVFMSYAIGRIRQTSFEKLSNFSAGIVIFLIAIGMTIFLAITSVMHYKIFWTNCYDMGIFVQMFHSLANHFTAVTTCERDDFLSHFYIHASYIYYLLAPIYKLFPKPETLLIAQTILAMGGIIPLYLIAKKHNYKGFGLIAVCMIYIFYSGLLAPCFYDFHENAFLPTLLFWLIYAMDSRKYILFYIMAGLVCLVKEDAPLYVMCLAMYFFFEEKSRKRFHGIIISILSGIYFYLITSWLTKYGDGKMMASTRFGNLTINSDSGFAGIIKNVLSNPSYFFSLLIQENSSKFFMQTLACLLFLPFMTKKIYRFWLIIPYVIMNLVVGSGYHYASEIGYQYIFGTGCFLIYMLLLNCKDMLAHKRNILVTVSATACIITAFSLVSGKINFYERYQEKPEYYQNLEECLATIPENASVAAATWIVPHIANRDEIYLFDKNDFTRDSENNITGLLNIQRYDFYALNYKDENASLTISYLEQAGYEIFNQAENHIIIYVSPDYQFLEN